VVTNVDDDVTAQDLRRRIRRKIAVDPTDGGAKLRREELARIDRRLTRLNEEFENP
jgi:hypothetical protein